MTEATRGTVEVCVHYRYRVCRFGFYHYTKLQKNKKGTLTVHTASTTEQSSMGISHVPPPWGQSITENISLPNLVTIKLYKGTQDPQNYTPPRARYVLPVLDCGGKFGSSELWLTDTVPEHESERENDAIMTSLA